MVSASHSSTIVFFSSQARSRYLSLILLSFNFTSSVCRDVKVHYSADHRFFFFFVFGSVRSQVFLKFLNLPVSFCKPLESVPCAPTIIAITVISNFHKFIFFSLIRSKHLYIFSLCFIFTQEFGGKVKPTKWLVLFSLVEKNTSSGLLIGIVLSACISNYQGFSYDSSSTGCTRLCVSQHIHL